MARELPVEETAIGGFLFEMQWWHGSKFIQCFHAWEAPGGVIWERALVLYRLQQAHKALRDGRRGVTELAEVVSHG